MTDAPPTLDLDGLSELLAKATPDTDKSCSNCGGYGEWFAHAPNCDSDNCALAGGIDDCNGQVEHCMCLDALTHALRETAPALIAEVRRLRERALAAEAQRDEAREALRPFAHAGSIAGEPDPRWDFYAYRPAAGNEYAIMGNHLRKAHQVIEGSKP